MKNFIIEIALTHDHAKNHRIPDYFQAMYIPLDKDGSPDWSCSEPLTPPVLYEVASIDFGQYFMEPTVFALRSCLPEHKLERVEWSLEGPNDCAICPHAK